jgi:hypothetical protein
MRAYSFYLVGAFVLFISAINFAQNSTKQLAQQRCVINPAYCSTVK